MTPSDSGFDESTRHFSVDDLLGDQRPGSDADTGPIDVGHSDTASIDLAELRRDYARAGLRRTDLQSDPILQFAAWMRETVAAGQIEPTAATLATATPTGQPSARVVLLKGLDARGFRFFSNYTSRKGRELAANPHAALCFHWADVERQVRIEGLVERIPRAESEEYFHSRPAGSQISAASSPQSQVVANREELASRRREIENRYAGGQVALPDEWGGYRLWPELIEFWQGRPDRLHDRFRYRRNPDGDPISGDEWTIERLAP
jgi:pyridoxamine 5'-phosphate oxidase